MGFVCTVTLLSPCNEKIKDPWELKALGWKNFP